MKFWPYRKNYGFMFPELLRSKKICFFKKILYYFKKPDPFDLDKEIALFDEKVDMLFRSESSSKDVEVWDIKFPSMNDNDDDCE